MDDEIVWRITEPLEKIVPPRWMSVSTANIIETCPKRWKLSYNSYPGIWEKKGFPKKISESALLGDLIHQVAERLTHELISKDCVSTDDVRSVEVVRSLGGFSSIIEKTIGDIMSDWNDNPRARSYVPYYAGQLRKKGGEVRRAVQQLLRGVKIKAKSCKEIRGKANLPFGTCPELWISSQRLEWGGKVDLLNITEQDVEIIDYKSGRPSEAHIDQLRTYATIWYFDLENNPKRRVPTRLVVRYRNEMQEVPPLGEGELEKFGTKLIEKRRELSEALKEPVTAKPSADNCRYCSVRHMCDEYWNMIRSKCDEINSSGVNVDAEVKIVKRLGEKSWLCENTACGRVPESASVVLRTRDLRKYRVGQKLRIIDGILVQSIESEEENSWAVIAQSRLSEVFFFD